MDAAREGDLRRVSRDDVAQIADKVPLHSPDDTDWTDELKQKTSDLSSGRWLYLILLLVLVVEQAMAVRLSYHAQPGELEAPRADGRRGPAPRRRDDARGVRWRKNYHRGHREHRAEKGRAEQTDDSKQNLFLLCLYSSVFSVSSVVNVFFPKRKRELLMNPNGVTLESEFVFRRLSESFAGFAADVWASVPKWLLLVLAAAAAGACSCASPSATRPSRPS